MIRSITAAVLVLTVSCGVRPVVSSTGERYPKSLSYAQYHTLSRGLSAPTVIRIYGPPAATVRQGDRVVGLSYACEDADGKLTELRMLFDGDERLSRWGLRKTGQS
jgi:hypothetical protein